MLSGALAWAVLGGVLAAFDPAGILERNADGIPRWLPLTVSAALACAALAAWRPRIMAGLCAAFWGVAAACFARPGLQAHGLPDVRLEPLLLLLALACLALATLPGLTAGRRLALGAPAFLTVFAGAAIVAPPGAAAHWAAAITYPLTLAAALQAAAIRRRHAT